MGAGAIIDRVPDPLTEGLTPEAAESILRFRADPETQARINELAAKADTQPLEEEEQIEYRELIDAFDLVAVLKSRARRVLADTKE